MTMKTRIALVSALVATLTTSCATQKLWEATNPDALGSIPVGEVSEAELRERGVPYLKDEHGIYHVGKTRMERFEDHALRFAFTPAALCVDAAPYVALISVCAFAGCQSVDFGGLTSPSSSQSPWGGGRR